jgi:hypothetical protein
MTLRKRIALVAVSALGAGLLSVVPVTSANAAPNVAAGSTSTGAATEGVLNIGTGLSVSGSGVASATAAGNLSLGLINVSDIAGGLVAGTTQTAVLLSSGRLAVYSAATTSGTDSVITVTGGTLSGAVGNGGINGAATAVVKLGASNGGFGVVVAPSSGVTSMTVALYTQTGSRTVAQALASPTSGTLAGQIVVTIAAASTAGVMSATNSGLFLASSATDQGNTSDDAAALGVAAFNADQFMNIRTRDAFASALTSTTGLLQVSATNGALVKLDASNASSDGTQSADYATGAASDNYMVRISAPSTAPVQTTVTATYNGVVVGTRTVVFTGEVAKVTLSSPAIGKTSNTASNYAYYKLQDAAGNNIYTTIAGSASTATPDSGLLPDSSLYNTTVSAVTKNREYSLGNDYSTVTSGRVTFTCGATAGKSTITLSYVNISGTIVKSNVLPVTCAGNPYTYAATWDKASYQPGDVATLTVTVKDSKGNLANDVTAIAGASGDLPVVSVGGLDKTITGPTATDVLDQGVLQYKYTIGSTEGTFSGTVKFPLIDAAQVSAVGSAAAVTTTVKVAASTTAVTNADVLKAIVSLIASINKQIAALQKALLKR